MTFRVKNVDHGADFYCLETGCGWTFYLSLINHPDRAVEGARRLLVQMELHQHNHENARGRE